VGIVGGAAGIISLVVQFVRDRARPQLTILRSVFGNEPGVGWLEIRFEISNVGNFPTSITQLSAWMMDGMNQVTGELERLRPNESDTLIRTGYRPEEPPPMTVSLPQRLRGHSSEIYTATFRMETVIQTGQETTCGLIIRHTHAQVSAEAVTHPQPIQRAVGRQGE
jgi:hypothetical protein